tara:strand:+ start:867 stop:1028 length:162 start_codon:yes stop_codon:yes gene_type:complete
MISLVRPIIFAFLKSKSVSILVCDILEALAKLSENKLDDVAVAKIREMLLEEK